MGGTMFAILAALNLLTLPLVYGVFGLAKRPATK